MKVEDDMTCEVFAAPPGASFNGTAPLLVEHPIPGLPVVDIQNHVLGVVSEADVLPKEAAGLQIHSPLAWLTGFDTEVDRSKLARTIGEPLTAPALTIGWPGWARAQTADQCREP